MNISTFSIVVGGRSCDGACPFCVSHTTGFEALTNDDINWQAFSEAVALARQAGTTTVLFTGKGEPCLYPHEITMYLTAIRALGDECEFSDGSIHYKLHKLVFPLVELQTNGIRIGKLAEKCEWGDKVTFRQLSAGDYKFFQELSLWRGLGLRTIALSVVGVEQTWNQQVYLHHREDVVYPDLAKTIAFLHHLGFKVRMCVMMQKGMVDKPQSVEKTICWCKEHHVDQLTLRPIRRPMGEPKNEYDEYINKFGLTDEEESIRQYVKANGTHIHTIMMGDKEAPVYDFGGQNVCMADCLTVTKEPNTIRTLILYPRSGEVCYDWQYSGAKL